MAKKSVIERNRKRQRLARKHAARRALLKSIANDRSRPIDERFQARLKLAELPRNSSAVRVGNRCEVTGRARGTYRKFRMSRITLRGLAALGRIPGMVKSSW